MSTDPKLPPILAAEDEETDAILLRLAFERALILNPLIVVHDGQEALDYLVGDSPYEDRTAHPFPGLLILDLKMPRMSGFDVLKWLSTKTEFADLPAVVLSSSSDESDKEKARQLGARDYFVKPLHLAQFVETIQTLHARWASGRAKS